MMASKLKTTTKDGSTTEALASTAPSDALASVDVDQALQQFSSELYEQWDAICDRLEEDGNNETVQWLSKNFLRKLSIEAPVTVGYVFACCLLHLLNVTFFPGISRWLGIRQSFHLLWTNPMQYIWLLTHIFGHHNMIHLRNNMTQLLLVGPSAEHVFGSKNIALIMVAVAVSSGFGHMLVGPKNSTQIGASGVVFALILLNSLLSAQSGKIPLSFVLTTCLFVGDELYHMLFSRDTIAHSAHLIGAVVGTAAGYMIHEHRESQRLLAEAAHPSRSRKPRVRMWNPFHKRGKTKTT